MVVAASKPLCRNKKAQPQELGFFIYVD